MPYLKAWILLALSCGALHAQSALHIRTGTEANIPATCATGDWYWANNATPGLNTFYCTATNIWTRNGAVPPPVGTPGYQPNQTLTGCGVEYISGLIFNVGACAYTIAGVTYNSVLTQKTLTAADASNPRIDVIGVDNTGVVFVSTGTAAASPQQPTIDPATQLGLTFVYVAALATTPTGVSFRDIYEENTEWTSAVTANFAAASTSNPYRGTKDIEATTAVSGNSVTLTKPAAGTENLTSWNTLTFYIRSKATWPNGSGSGSNGARFLNIFWLSGATQVGVPVILRDGQFGFSSSSTSAYQQISIPASLFGTGSNTVTTLKIQVAGNGGTSSIGFYLDAITLQGGNGIITLPATLMNFRGTWVSTAAYNVYDSVVSSGIGYVALLANTNVAVGTASTWAALAPAATGGTVTNIATTSPITGGPITGTGTVACASCVTSSSPGVGLAHFAGSTQAVTSSTIVNADIANSTIDLTAKVTGVLPSANSQPHVIGFIIDGGGAAITTGDKGIYPTAAFACTINRIDISADQSGSITVDVWKRAGLIPTSGQKISASAPLTLSSAQLAQNGSLSGWTTAVASGDVFGFSVASVTTVTRVVGQIWCQ